MLKRLNGWVKQLIFRHRLQSKYTEGMLEFRYLADRLHYRANIIEVMTKLKVIKNKPTIGIGRMPLNPILESTER